MSSIVPVGVTQLGSSGFIGSAGTSQILSWVNVVATTTPANVTIFSFQNNSTASGNTVCVVGTGGDLDNIVQHFEDGLLCLNGCVMVTDSNVSMINVGHRSYAG